MSPKRVFLTHEGLAKLEAELEHLQSVRRAEVAKRIQTAKELGGTANNAEYEEAKNEQAFVEGRILTLENMIKNATIIPDSATTSGEVKLGSRVTVLNSEGGIEQYTIVGSVEANPRNGKISNECPVGTALMGRRAGDKVKVDTPAGSTKLTIIGVS